MTTNSPKTAGPAVSMQRLPFRGWVVSGAPTATEVAGYFETDAEAKKAFLDSISSLSMPDPTNTSRHYYAALGTEVIQYVQKKSWGYLLQTNRPLAKRMIKERESNVSGVRIVNAYLMSYDEGLTVCRDLESVGIFLDEFFKATPLAADIDRALPDAPPHDDDNKPLPGGGRFTPQELREFLERVSRDVDEAIGERPPELSSPVAHPSSSTESQ